MQEKIILKKIGASRSHIPRRRWWNVAHHGSGGNEARTVEASLFKREQFCSLAIDFGRIEQPVRIDIGQSRTAVDDSTLR